jgi:phosphate/sulfate permease
MANSVAHGSNDVANSVGPFAAIWGIYLTGTVQVRGLEHCRGTAWYQFTR